MGWNAASFVSALVLSGCIFSPLCAQTERRDTADLWFLCGWDPRSPSSRRVVVDLSLQAGQFNRTPNADDIRAVQAAGGHVLYQFPIALLRADLDTGAIRDLVDGPHAIADAAFTVPDTAKYNADVQIFYKRPITGADEEALRQLGLDDRLKMPIPVIQTVTPDSLIPRIAALPGVDFVRATAWGCMEPLQASPLLPRPASPGRVRSNQR